MVEINTREGARSRGSIAIPSLRAFDGIDFAFPKSRLKIREIVQPPPGGTRGIDEVWEGFVFSEKYNLLPASIKRWMLPANRYWGGRGKSPSFTVAKVERCTVFWRCLH